MNKLLIFALAVGLGGCGLKTNHDAYREGYDDGYGAALYQCLTQVAKHHGQE